MARCAVCDGTLPVTCNCTLGDSASVNVSGAGSSASPYTLDPIIDPAAGNLVSCGASGMLAAFPARVLSPPRARVARISDKSITQNTDVYIDFDSEDYDTDGFHDNVTNNTRLTNPLGITACFVVSFSVAMAMSGFATTDDWWIGIRKDGATHVIRKTHRVETIDFLGSFTITDQISVETELTLGAAGYVEGFARQTSAGSRTSPAQPRAAVMAITYLGD